MWVSAHVKCVTNKSRDQTNIKVGDTLMVKTGGGHVLVVQQSKDTETSVPSETIGCSNWQTTETRREKPAEEVLCRSVEQY